MCHWNSTVLWREMTLFILAHLSQVLHWLYSYSLSSKFPAQRARGPVHTCVPGRVEARGLQGRWAGLGGSGRVTTQTWSLAGKTKGMEYEMYIEFTKWVTYEFALYCPDIILSLSPPMPPPPSLLIQLQPTQPVGPPVTPKSNEMYVFKSNIFWGYFCVVYFYFAVISIIH